MFVGVYYFCVYVLILRTFVCYRFINDMEPEKDNGIRRMSYRLGTHSNASK